MIARRRQEFKYFRVFFNRICGWCGTTIYRLHFTKTRRCAHPGGPSLITNHGDLRLHQRVFSYPWRTKMRDCHHEIQRILKNDFIPKGKSLIA